MDEKPEQIKSNEPDSSLSSNQSNAVKPAVNNQTLIVIIALLIIVAGMACVSVWYVMDKQNADLKQKNAELTKLKESADSARSDKVVIDSNGVATSTSSMLEISDLNNITWEYDSATYTANKATQTPMVADMGAYRDNYNGKEWVAVEVTVNDDRTSGERRDLSSSIASTIRLVDGSNKIPPIDDQYYIAPLESKTINVLFPVDDSSNLFSLWTGNLAKPTITDLDFAKADKLTGYYYMKTGYSKKQQ